MRHKSCASSSSGVGSTSASEAKAPSIVKAAHKAASSVGSRRVAPSEGKAAPPKKKVKVTQSADLRCVVCGASSLSAKWAKAEKGKDNEVTGSACWECMESYRPFRHGHQTLESFAAWCRTSEGEAAVAKANQKRAGGGVSVAEATMPEEVIVSRAHGGRIIRELYIMNESEFKNMFHKSPMVRMPRLPTFVVPTESMTGTEKVWGFMKTSTLYPLRTFQLWCDVKVEQISYHMSACDLPAFKAQARTKFDAAVDTTRTESGQQVLFSTGQVLSVDEFGSRYAPEVFKPEPPPQKKRKSLSSPSKSVVDSDGGMRDADTDGARWTQTVHGTPVGSDAEADDLLEHLGASVSDCENEQPDAECGEDNVCFSRMTGTSEQLLETLKKKLGIATVLAGHKLGRSVKGAATYLTNGRLSETDVYFLQLHLDLVTASER